MYKLARFDAKEYKKLLYQFERSRKGKEIQNLYQELSQLKPEGYITDELKAKLDKWCNTNPKGSWGAAVPYANRIRKMILDPNLGGGEYIEEVIERLLPSEDIKKLFNMPYDFESDWNLKYGITNNRKNSMIDNVKGRNSALNPSSETFLTFFSLTNLDQWQQPDCLRILLRKDDSENSLNADLFEKIRKNEDDFWKAPKEIEFDPKKIIPTLTDKESMKFSIIFFETDIMSSAINPYEDSAFRDLTFLDYQIERGWSEFDAFIYLPREHRIVFIESKLESDMGKDVKGDIKIPQIVRALESAYLFTHHDDSKFHNWSYDYLVICPRYKYEDEPTDYSRLIHEIKKPNSDMLRKKYVNHSVDLKKTDLFEDFLLTAPKHLYVLFWDKLYDIFEDMTPGFLTDYMKNLKDIKHSAYDGCSQRFKKARIL